MKYKVKCEEKKKKKQEEEEEEEEEEGETWKVGQEIFIVMPCNCWHLLD